MKKSEIIFDCLLVPIDLLMIICAFIFAYFLRSYNYVLPVNLTDYLKWIVMVLPIWLIVFIIAGLYREDRRFKIVDQIYNIFAACSIGIMLTVVIIFMRREFFFSRLIIIYGWIFSGLFVFLGRLILEKIQQWLFKFGVGVYKVLIVGGGQVATTQILEEIENHPELGYEIVGILDDVETIGSKIKGVKIVGRLKDLEKIYQKNKFDEIIQTRSNLPYSDFLKMINFCREKRLRFRFKPDFLEIRMSRVKPVEFGHLSLVELRDIPLEGWNRIIKRLIDLIVSIIGLIALFPLFLIVSILIKLTSPGPVFFKQIRIGRGGKRFNLLKFRSMYVTAEDGSAEAKTGPVRTRPDDQRRTPIGKIIRRLSIDELPQLINVLKGEMSLVGPRPERPEFVEIYKKKISSYDSRHRVKPGITGWAQINGLRGFTSIEERTHYDIYYIENWSLLFDLKIILKTFWVVLKGDEAY